MRWCCLVGFERRFIMSRPWKSAQVSASARAAIFGAQRGRSSQQAFVGTLQPRLCATTREVSSRHVVHPFSDDASTPT